MQLRDARRRNLVNDVQQETKVKTKAEGKVAPVNKVSTWRPRIVRDRTRFNPDEENSDKIDHMKQVFMEDEEERLRPCRSKRYS